MKLKRFLALGLAVVIAAAIVTPVCASPVLEEDYDTVTSVGAGERIVLMEYENGDILYILLKDEDVSPYDIKGPTHTSRSAGDIYYETADGEYDLVCTVEMATVWNDSGTNEGIFRFDATLDVRDERYSVWWGSSGNDGVYYHWKYLYFRDLTIGGVVTAECYAIYNGTTVSMGVAQIKK